MKRSRSPRSSTVEKLEARIAPATLVVTTLADSGPGSLRQAILDANAAPGADEIVFHHGGMATPLKGIIHLKSSLPAITDEVTIHDPFITTPGKQNVVIDGQHHAIFAVGNLSAMQTVTISDLALANGHAVVGGAISIDARDGSVTLSNLLLAHNHAAQGGGLNVASGSVLLDHSKVTGNTAQGAPGEFASGGGINVDFQAQLEVQHSAITHNMAAGGNGYRGSNGGRDFVQGVYFYADSGASGGGANGGGISTDGTLTLTSSTVSQNVARGANGGAGGNGEKASLYTPRDEPYVGGDGGYGGDASGGGIGTNAGNTTITDSLILSNLVLGGHGAPGGAGGTPISYYPEDGGAGGAGGHADGAGIEAGGGKLTIDSSTVAQNYGAGGTGSAGGAPGRSGHAGRSAFAAVASTGGGLSSTVETVVLSQATVALNTAAHGGGIYSNDDYSVRIANSTVALNSARQGSGLWTDDSSVAVVQVISTIIAENGAARSAEIYGAFTSDHNLIQKYPAAAISDVNTIVGVNPRLGPLKLNGGGTLTMLPAAKSAVIGEGVNPDGLMVDARGDARMTGDAIDIGAVEV